jgi:hypothetical protein
MTLSKPLLCALLGLPRISAPTSRFLPQGPSWLVRGSLHSSTTSRYRHPSCGAGRGKLYTSPATIAAGRAVWAGVFFFQLAHHAVDDCSGFILVHWSLSCLPPRLLHGTKTVRITTTATVTTAAPTQIAQVRNQTPGVAAGIRHPPSACGATAFLLRQRSEPPTRQRRRPRAQSPRRR